ncbi:hypothetical protein EWM64_g2870 [Hericium alpestre]|uniref:Uncharacterized protein n=1 Tax=Hericium alpestre TaxID=135208 RepID=A0A4Z0A262_9AGAM|nr:hypothetical protein EWM64_g2870 [Hericium alpestre]
MAQDSICMAPKSEVKDEVIDVDAQPEPEVQFIGCRWGTSKKRRKAHVTGPKTPVIHNIISDSEDESSAPTEPGPSTPRIAPPRRPDVHQVVKARYNEVKRKGTKPTTCSSGHPESDPRAGSSSGRGTTDDPMVISDDNDDTTQAIPSLPVAKRLKLDPSPDWQAMPMDLDPPWQSTSAPEPLLTDSEDEYPTIHAALDMQANRNWKPLPTASEIIDRVPDGPEPSPKHISKHRRKTIHGYLVDPPVRIGSRPAAMENQRWLWDLCTSSNLPKPRRPPSSVFLRNATRLKPFDWSERTVSLFDDLQYSLLTRSTSFREAGGFISNISQVAGAIAVSSATPGGQVEDDDISNDHILHGHDIIPSYSSRRKFFTVNDVKFDPKE